MSAVYQAPTATKQTDKSRCNYMRMQNSLPSQGELATWLPQTNRLTTTGETEGDWETKASYYRAMDVVWFQGPR